MKNDLKICKDCKVEKPISEFQSKKARCKVCEYIRLHDIVVVDGWTLEKYKIVLDLIINIKIKYINEIEEIINIPVEKIAHLLNNHLKIGNKPIEILCMCEMCKKEMSIHPCKLFKNKHVFCSSECYWKHKKINTPHGKDSPDYNRITTNCTNCDIILEVTPWYYNMVNSYGDNHNFCSQKCYWEYRSKYYVGEKSVMYNYVFSDEQKERCRINTVKKYEEGVFNTETKPQLAVNHILNNLDIKYQREKGFKYYNADNYLIDYNLIIEVMGDYFHASPKKYKDITKLNKMQKKDISRDKSKRTYIKKYYNIDILYLWEHDVNKNPELCSQLIQNYVNNKGCIENYNSFNYFLDINNNIKLSKNIIRPYFEIPNKNP